MMLDRLACVIAALTWTDDGSVPTYSGRSSLRALSETVLVLYRSLLAGGRIETKIQPGIGIVGSLVISTGIYQIRVIGTESRIVVAVLSPPGKNSIIEASRKNIVRELRNAIRA
jgi:hypothetical protein